MLWLALYFPALPLEVFSVGLPPGQPFAVSVRRDGRDLVERCNAAANELGVRPGMPLQAALALHAGLQLHARDPAREADALQELAHWAYQFSAHIAFDPLTLLLEVGASLRLFGGADELQARLLAQLDTLGHRARHASAPTPAAAGLLARARPGCLVRDPAGLRAALADIPVARLTRDARARGLLRDIGLASIGDALALPRPELVRRAGPQLGLQLDRLLGCRPDPRAPWQPPQRFERRLELPAGIAHCAALVFPARRLLEGLCGYLRGRGGAAQHLAWALEHRVDADTLLEQGLLEGSRDPVHLLEMFRERIERVRLVAPVIALRLRVADWQPFVEKNATWLADASDPDRHLLERLRSRLGERHVRGLRLCADHRPEKAWSLCLPGEVRGQATAAGLRPAWLLHRPRPLRQEQGGPFLDGPLQVEPPPLRIESGWWDGEDVSRDYYLARTPGGERLWVFHDRRHGGWYLHGLFD